MLTLYAPLLFVLTGAQDLPGVPFDFLVQKSMDDYKFPVPFGHIYREGFGDPYSDLKQPLDLLELDMRRPKNKEEAMRLLQKTKSNKIRFYKRPDKVLTREAFFEADGDVDAGRLNLRNNRTDGWPILRNLAAIQMSNARTPHPKHGRKDKKKPMIVSSGPQDIPRSEFFADHGFELPTGRAKKVNWTTCDEFGSKVFLNPRDIVDIKWVPFYVWSIKPIRHAVVHRFSYPTQKLVKKYHESYHKHLNKTVDWKQPKLLMSGLNEFLLIAVNKRGSFVGIHEHSVPSSIKDLPIIIPTVNIRLKIEDPYLLMMFCDDYYATIMAVSGDEPATYKDKIAEAATAGFKGVGRPVWRDLKAEKDSLLSERRQQVMEEEDKIIRIREDYPPMY